MAYSTLFFDLDDTLYPSSNGVWAAIRYRMNQYMLEMLQLPPDEIAALRKHYFETYGTTLRGLQVHHQVDADEFLAYVHDLPIDTMVQPDPELRTLLSSLDRNKFIFTNADASHAERVLDALGVKDCFDGVIDVRAVDFKCKPDPEAYQMAMRQAGEKLPQSCVYLDDAPRNLAPAYDLGWFTILVGRKDPDPAARQSVLRPHELRQILPELWQDNHKNALEHSE